MGYLAVMLISSLSSLSVTAFFTAVAIAVGSAPMLLERASMAAVCAVSMVLSSAISLRASCTRSYVRYW